MAKERVLGKWRKGRSFVRVKITKYRGHYGIDIREWFKTDDGALAPTRRGVRLRPRDITPLRKALRRGVKIFDAKELL
jgi:hypothetical protein